MFCNNDNVVKSTSRVESTLSKKRKLISWHSVREAVSDLWMRVLKDPGETNLVGIFTKKLHIQGRE